MEQLVLLLLFGAIALIQWLVKKSAEMREQRKREQQAQRQGEPDIFREVEPPAPRQAEDPDASMRKLMEALGLPQEAPPPPVPQRQPVPPPLPQASAPPVPQLRPAPKFAERPTPKIPEKPAFKLPEKPFITAAKLGVPAAKSKPFDPSPEKKPDFSIRELLASPDSMKKAVILSEIIGSPKALRS